MNRVVTAVSLAAVIATSSAAFAQAKKAPVKKAAASTTAPAAQNKTIVLGTTQLPGDFGKLGQTYTIGKDAPINFTLDSAHYAIDRFTVNSNTWAPKKDEKLLVLRFTVHNPLPREQSYYWGSIRFTAVDALDTNREAVQTVVRTGVYDQGAFNTSLKPAQKVQLETVIVVPANGQVPKLIVEREKNAPVIRYDLRGKVAAVPAPFADAADSTGSTALAEVPVQAGTFYPLAVYDVKLDSVEYTTEALAKREPKPGYRYVTATFTVKNASKSERAYYWGYFDATLRDADGEKVDFQQALLKASRNEVAQGNLEPGEETRVRLFFPVPEKVNAKTLYLRESYLSGNKGRVLAFDLDKAPVNTAATTP